MFYQMVFSILFVSATICQDDSPPIVVNAPATHAASGCGAQSPEPHAQNVGAQPASKMHHGNVHRKLEGISDLDLTGHPAPIAGLLTLIGQDEGDELAGWNIQVLVDEHALTRHGIRLDELVPSELHASGVDRRSSLRFVLDSCGLGYYVGDKCVVVTTKPIAQIGWLSELPKPTPNSLKSDTIVERRNAAFAAGYRHIDPDTWIEPLTKALHDPDRQVAFDAAYALGVLGPQADRAINHLLKMLKSDDLTLREASVSALGKIGEKAVEGLLTSLDDPDSAIVFAAAKSLGVMGSAGKSAVPGLIAAGQRHSSNVDLCERIGTSISEIDLGDAIPKLRELLKSNQVGIRSFAAQTIGSIGPRANSCAEELLSLLADKNTRVRIAVAYALAHIDLAEDVPISELEAAAKDSDRHVQLWAQKALRVVKSKKGM